VRGWNLNDERDEDTTADVLAHHVLTAAQEDAEGLGGHQRYELRAYGTTDTQPLGRILFEVRSDGEASEDSSPLEEATPKGQVAQAQRHAETMFRMVTNYMSEAQAQTHGIITMLQKRNETLETRELEVLEMRERLSVNDHQRKLDIARETRTDRL